MITWPWPTPWRDLDGHTCDILQSVAHSDVAQLKSEDPSRIHLQVRGVVISLPTLLGGETTNFTPWPSS